MHPCLCVLCLPWAHPTVGGRADGRRMDGQRERVTGADQGLCQHGRGRAQRSRAAAQPGGGRLSLAACVHAVRPQGLDGCMRRARGPCRTRVDVRAGSCCWRAAGVLLGWRPGPIQCGPVPVPRTRSAVTRITDDQRRIAGTARVCRRRAQRGLAGKNRASPRASLAGSGRARGCVRAGQGSCQDKGTAHDGG